MHSSNINVSGQNIKAEAEIVEVMEDEPHLSRKKFNNQNHDD